MGEMGMRRMKRNMDKGRSFREIKRIGKEMEL